MGAAAARSGAPCVPTATPGAWDIPPAIGDAWFIHYPIYTGCVAARLETRALRGVPSAAVLRFSSALVDQTAW